MGGKRRERVFAVAVAGGVMEMTAGADVPAGADREVRRG